MKQYEVHEITLRGKEPEHDWVNVDVAAEFALNGEKHKVKGFYAGNGNYKVRFFPVQTGICHYKIEGVVSAEGEEIVEPADGKHGRVRISGTHFTYDDGSTYLPFGTTVYAFLHQEKELIEQTLETLRISPFNKLRFCVFPKHYDFNKREPEIFAFEKKNNKWDVNKPCMAFWEAFEKRILQLADLGIEADIILFHPYDRWGFMNLSEKECGTYLEYMVRRISAFPNVWWSLANEYDLMDEFEQKRWEDMAAYIGKNDIYGHPLSNHNFVRPWDFSNKYTTHCCLQSSQTQKIPMLIKKYGKPVLFDEMGYEGNIPYNWGNLSAFEMVNRFWKVCCMGGYGTHGETYMEEMNDQQTLWWSKGGVLKGESPARIAFLKNLMESFPGPLSHYRPKRGMNIESQEQLNELLAENVPGISDNPVLRVMGKMNGQEFEHMLDVMTQTQVHYKDEVFLQYFGDMCTIHGSMDLPEENLYNVEVIDVWEMTRQTAAEGVNGKVEVKLPGKPGIALIAVKV